MTPEEREARREARAEAAAEAIREAGRQAGLAAPPLSEAQKRRLRVLLRPALEHDTA